MDSIDETILGILRRDARTPLRVIGRAVGLSTSGVRRRIKKLEREGVIRGYTIDEDRGGVVAFILVPNMEHPGGFEGRVSVEEAHRVTGCREVLMKVWARDMSSLRDYVRALDDRLPPAKVMVSLRELGQDEADKA